MGAEAARRKSGPWIVEVDFPSRFSDVILPKSPDDITNSVEILTPPTPAYGAVIGRMPSGLFIKGAHAFRHIELPVFEWTGYEVSLFSPYPYRNQHYFALRDKFRGETFRSSRLTIGKIALLDDVVACAMPVQDSWLSGTKIKETTVASQPKIEESVARAVFAILNGDSMVNGTYEEQQQLYEREQIATLSAARRWLSRLDND